MVLSWHLRVEDDDSWIQSKQTVFWSELTFNFQVHMKNNENRKQFFSRVLTRQVQTKIRSLVYKTDNWIVKSIEII